MLTGKSVEVLVYWQDVVVQAYHFQPQGEVYAGNQNHCDIFLPGQPIYEKHRFMKINGGVEVYGFDGKNYFLSGQEKGNSERLNLDVPSSPFNIEIGVVPASYKADVSPLFNFNSAESRTFIFSLLITLYIFFLTFDLTEEPAPNLADAVVTIDFPKQISVVRQSEGTNTTPKPSTKKIDPNNAGILKLLGNNLGLGGKDRLLKDSLETARDQIKSSQPRGFVGARAFKETGTGSGGGSYSTGDLKVNLPGVGRGPIGIARAGSIDKNSAEISRGSGDESIPGFMDKEAIRQVIKSHLSEIRACYEMKLNQDQTIAGKVVIQWQILENGSVGAARALSDRSTLGDRDVANCTANIIKGLRFPKPPAGMIGQVQYPFVFSSR